tara:strand:- start:56 stop:514 length:459 start_codon:yes stop_codon:yes gene_type:complete
MKMRIKPSQYSRKTNVISAFVLLCLAAGATHCNVDPEQELLNELKYVEENLNKTLPKQMDQMTTFTKVTAGPGKLFTYHYSLNTPLSSNAIPEFRKKQLINEIESLFCQEQGLKDWISRGVEIKIDYSNSLGQSLVEISSNSFNCNANDSTN